MRTIFCTTCTRRYDAKLSACPTCGRGEASAEDVAKDLAQRERVAEAEREQARFQRWIDRGSPTKAQSLAKINEILNRPKMSNLERAHLILSQDSPNLIALEWAREFVTRHQSGEEMREAA